MFPSPSPWIGSLTAIALISSLPLLVTFLLARREATVRRHLPQLTAFGAGAVFGAAVVHIIPEALASGQPAWAVALAVGAGFAAFWGIERVLAGHDHAHAHGVALGAPTAHDSASSEAACEHIRPEPPRGHAHRKHLVPMAFAGDAAHNLVDGMLIAAGFLADPSVGVFTVLAVALHELPREIGTFGLFVHGGVRPMRAVAYNAITALVSLAGAALTLLVGQQVTTFAAWLLPVAAGTYLYIAQVVGRAALHDEHRDPAHWGRLGWVAAGTALMVASAAVG